MFTEVPLFPEQGSTYAPEVDRLTLTLLGISLFFTVLITVLLFSFAIKYRRRSRDEVPPPLRASLVLELTWTLIPLVIGLGIFVWGADLFFRLYRAPEGAMEVYVVGKQWMWKMQHAGGQREINQLHVPVGRPVKLTMISHDVIHSFFVPAFRVHMDVLPSGYTSMWFEATKPGRYHLFCSEYCGTNHSKMIGEVIVMPQDEFAEWLERGPDGSMASEGRKLFLKLQCVSCHTGDASGRGPSLEEIAGHSVPLRDGRTVVADDNYLRESILKPDAKVVAGFRSIMPAYQDQVDEEELLQLLAYLKGLGRGQTPRRTEDSEPPERPNDRTAGP